MTVRLEGKPVAEGLYLRSRMLSDSPGAGARPCLASVHRGASTPFSPYLRQQEKAAERAGVRFRSVILDEAAGSAGLRERMVRLDAEPGVDAVLLEHPLPDTLDFFGAVSAIRPEKDVDGVGSENLGRLVAGRPLHVPSVARAALEIARYYGIDLEGRRVSVIGRSATVGLPLALLLLARASGGNATVTIAHARTRDLGRALEGAEVIFSCAGQPGLLTRKVVPEGAAVVDIGLRGVVDPKSPTGSRNRGDADSESLEGWSSALTPIPGGVGPVTVAALMLGAAESWGLLRETRAGA